MNPKEEFQPAFLIHARSYRESSLLVDFLTANFGRVSVVAKGARRSYKLRQLYQPYRPLHITWSGKTELKSLLSIEPTGPALSLAEMRLYSGMYLNELLYRLLNIHEPVPALFASYMSCLDALHNFKSSTDEETSLRLFELELLNVLGYGVDFSEDSITGDKIIADKSYAFSVREGFTEHRQQRGANRLSVPGELILMLQEDRWVKESLGLLKTINRLVIDDLLNGVPLNSRQLYKSASLMRG